MDNGFDLIALRSKVETGEIIELVAENPFLVGDLLDQLSDRLPLVTELPEELIELLTLVAEIDAQSSTEIVRNVPTLIVTGDAERNRWVDETLPRVLGWQKHADEIRTALKRPFLEAGRQVDDLFRDTLALLNTIVRRIKDADKEYRDRIRAEQAATAAEVQERQQQQHIQSALDTAAKLESQGETDKAQQVIERAITAPLPPVTTAGPPLPKLQNSSLVKRWKFEVVDPALVPREYCVPSDKLIKARVDTFGDKADLPGVRIWQDEDLSTRAIKPARAKANA